ncbi:ABC transporter ATP-binding protein [Candidatus Albibeggiatoa sp. nov. BB20]|uniref:ABC transporter ATP-binding protein n=1 Tax=Candidatus Albibeggiatoa sp. nov. BB20 TaxID=3162723 RepID=UPI00336566A7
MNNHVIQLQQVQFRWTRQGSDILNIPTVDIQQGQHVFIYGKSGCGKTTLLNLIAGIHRPQVGTVEVLNTNLNLLSATRRDQFRADHFGIIFQQFNLLPYLSVLENVLLPCYFSAKRKSKAGKYIQTALRLLDELQIAENQIHQSIQKLSVGQQQRIAVARALIGQPEIIIADEPTSALDADNQQRFIELLFTEAQQQNSTVIFVSHDLQLARSFSTVLELSAFNQATI